MVAQFYGDDDNVCAAPLRQTNTFWALLPHTIPMSPSSIIAVGLSGHSNAGVTGFIGTSSNNPSLGYLLGLEWQFLPIQPKKKAWLRRLGISEKLER
ncbi:hypothetical protein TNCV_33111 [Trichonephila clavipes]|nr:hypothetical protein TNCV_33111 [Trichonephila clavipes]